MYLITVKWARVAQTSPQRVARAPTFPLLKKVLLFFPVCSVRWFRCQVSHLLPFRRFLAGLPLAAVLRSVSPPQPVASGGFRLSSRLQAAPLGEAGFEVYDLAPRGWATLSHPAAKGPLPAVMTDAVPVLGELL